MRSVLTTAMSFLCFAATTARGHELYVAFWNVENLMDTADDPAVEFDEEFSPDGKLKWTEERLETKLKNLARVIRKMNEGKGPDVLGIAEIENRLVLERLVKHLEPLKRSYKIVHQDSPSGRGIDTAILYDDGALKLVGSKFHRVEGVSKPTRDIAEAELSTSGGAKLFVFANHWPSRANPEEDRLQAATTLRKRANEILVADAKADFVILGDFNDYPDNKSIQQTLRALENLNGEEGALLNTMWPMQRAGNRGTYVFQNKWEIIDHIIVSPGLLDDKGFTWRKDSTDRVLEVEDQLYKPKNGPLARPRRVYSGDYYSPRGISDHLPVKTVLEYP